MLLRRILNANAWGLFSVIVLAGCDPADSEVGSYDGLDGASDIITFKLPSTPNKSIKKYYVELVNPNSKKRLNVKEGRPGETLIFIIGRVPVCVNALLTAVDPNGAVIDATEVTVLDLDYKSLNCEIRMRSQGTPSAALPGI